MGIIFIRAVSYPVATTTQSVYVSVTLNYTSPSPLSKCLLGHIPLLELHCCSMIRCPERKFGL
eukprot:5671793-Amphidinium_carterae.1